jgi:putative ABC transport system permease protein
MLAVGVRRHRIRTLFLSEALLLGFFSAGVGSLIGFGVVSWLGRRGITMAFGPNDPVTYIPQVTFGFLLTVVLFTVAGALVAALYPAWKGSRLRPVEALRAP